MEIANYVQSVIENMNNASKCRTKGKSYAKYTCRKTGYFFIAAKGELPGTSNI